MEDITKRRFHVERYQKANANAIRLVENIREIVDSISNGRIPSEELRKQYIVRFNFEKGYTRDYFGQITEVDKLKLLQERELKQYFDDFGGKMGIRGTSAPYNPLQPFASTPPLSLLV